MSNFIEWFYHHPTQPYQLSARGQGLAVRLRESGWLYRQALIAWVSGLAPHQLMFSHSTGPLLILSFVAMFALAYEVTGRAAVAWLSLLFTTASYFVDYFTRGPYLIGHPGFGAQVLRTIAEDKVVNGFVFVPAALALTLYLIRAEKRQRPASWLLWALALVTVFSTHPHGFGLYLLIVGSYALVTLLAAPPDWRKLVDNLPLGRRWRWLQALVALGLGTAIAAVPLYQVLNSRRTADLFDWDSANKIVFGGIIDVSADGLYILHPGLVSAWIFVLGIGVGLLMSARLRYDRTARYIFAATAGPLIAGYTPYLTAVLGNIIRTHNLVRLVWLLPVGLALAYACWLALDWLRAHSHGAMHAFLALALVPSIAAVAIIWPNYQQVTREVFDRSSRPAWPEYSSPPIEDLAEALAPITTREMHLLAPPEVNTYLFTVNSDIFVYGFRSGYLELYGLYQNPWWGEDAYRMFETFKPVRLVVERGSAQHTDARFRDYERIYANERYVFYQIEQQIPPLSQTDRAHSLIASREDTLVDFFIANESETYAEPAAWEDIAALYESALADHPDDSRALYGLAYVRAQMGEWASAETLYRNLLGRFPDDGNIRAGLAGALWAQARRDEAFDVLLAYTDPAALRALLDTPYLEALDGARLGEVLDAWAAQPNFVSGPHAARALADRLLALRSDRASARRVLEHIAPDYRTPDDLILLGTLYLVDGEMDTALTVYESGATRSTVCQGLSHLTRGHMAMQGSSPAAARDAYQAAAELDAAPPAAWVYLGLAHEALGDEGAAEQAYWKATQYEAPAAVWGNAALYRLYLDQGEDAAAQAAYERTGEALAAAGIAPFAPDAPPEIIVPGLAPAGATLPQAVLLEAAVGARGVRDGETLPVAPAWMDYRAGDSALWWQIKAISGEKVRGDTSWAALTPAWGAVRWPFSLPVEVPDSAAVANIEAVISGPEAVRSVTAWLGQAMLGEPTPPDESPRTEASVVFGETVRLYGYTVPDEVSAGEAFTLTLFWEALAPSPDLKVFVHVLDADGATLAQADKAPGWYPSALWETGAQVAGTFALNIPEDAAPGRYHVVTGLYDPVTLTRLPVEGAPDNMVEIKQVQVGRQK